MPARQRGSTVRRGKTWAARWRDENNEARFRGGFNTKTEAARAWLDRKMPDVEALRGRRPRRAPTSGHADAAGARRRVPRPALRAEHEGDADREAEVRDRQVRRRAARSSRRVGASGVTDDAPRGVRMAHREGAPSVARLRGRRGPARHEPGKGDPEPGAEANRDPAVCDPRRGRDRLGRVAAALPGDPARRRPDRATAVGAARARTT
jgi:hypothetical protein